MYSGLFVRITFVCFSIYSTNLPNDTEQVYCLLRCHANYKQVDLMINLKGYFT